MKTKNMKPKTISAQKKNSKLVKQATHHAEKIQRSSVNGALLSVELQAEVRNVLLQCAKELKFLGKLEGDVVTMLNHMDRVIAKSKKTKKTQENIY